MLQKNKNGNAKSRKKQYFCNIAQKLYLKIIQYNNKKAPAT